MDDEDVVLNKIAIVYDSKYKPQTEEPAKKAIKYFKQYCDVLVNPQMYRIDIDAVIVYGGDGLLLHTADKIASIGIPIIGVNFGRIGYLCKVHPFSNNFKFWDKLLQGNYSIEHRTRIASEIETGSITEYLDALNEISIGRTNRTVYLNMTINQDFQLPIYVDAVGDGIIFSTKTGSTAYNINAGGSVLIGDAFSVVANNSVFTSKDLPVNTKSIVTSTMTEFKIEMQQRNISTNLLLTADGQRNRKLFGDEVITIKKSIETTKFINIIGENARYAQY